MVPVSGHPDCKFNRLQKPCCVYAAEYKAALVQCFGTLRAGSDAYGRNGLADRGIETALLREGAAVADHAERVHLEAVVVVEAERLLNLHPGVKFESCSLEPVARARMATVEDGHVVLLGHCIYRIEKAEEIFLRIDVLLPVGRQQYVPTLFKPEPLQHVRCLYVGKVLPEDFRHRGAGDVRAFARQAAFGQIAACMFRIGQVHVRDDVHYPAVGLLRQTLVLTSVACLHVEDGDVQPLGAYHAQARVGVSQNQHCIRLCGDHQLVAGIDDVAAGGTEVVPDGVHVHFRVFQFQITEKYAVEGVVVVLSCVCKENIEVFAGLVDHGGKTDDLRSRPYNDKKFDFAVVGKVYVRIVCFQFHVLLFFYRVKVCIRMVLVEDLVAIHHRDEVLSLGQVDDVMGIAGKHDYALYPVSADFIVQDLVRAFLTELNESVSRHDDELLPLCVVPVLPLGNAGFRDVDGHLPAVEGADQLGKAAPFVRIHVQVEDGFLLGQIAKICAEQAFGKTLGKHFRYHQGFLHVGKTVEHVNYLA